MDGKTWIAVCAHRLQRQWRTVDPNQLDEVAADLWADEKLGKMEPAQAAELWLEPLRAAYTRAYIIEQEKSTYRVSAASA